MVINVIKNTGLFIVGLLAMATSYDLIAGWQVPAGGGERECPAHRSRHLRHADFDLFSVAGSPGLGGCGSGATDTARGRSSGMAARVRADHD